MIYIDPITGLVILGIVGALFAREIGLTRPVGALIGAAIGVVFGLGKWFQERLAYDRTKAEYDRQLFKKFYARHPDEKPGKKRKKARRDDD